MNYPIIILQHTKLVLPYRKKKYSSILEVLEAYQLKVEFQCRAGYCGFCKIMLLKGIVKYHYNPIAFLQKNEILPCCCLPINTIEIILL